MSGRFDPSLLDSPLSKKPRRWWPLILVVAGVVVAVMVWILAIVLAGDGSGDDAAPTESAPSTTAVQPLVAFSEDPHMLHHPTLLPAGMELCGASLGVSLAGDQFCDPDDEGRWIRVASIVGGGAPGGTPVEGFPGVTVVSEGRPEVGVNINGRAGFRLWSQGVALDRLIEVAASLPINDPLVLAPSADELPVVLDESTLAALIGRPDATARRDANGGWTVLGGDLLLYTPRLVPGATDFATDREMVSQLASPRLVSPEHGLVVGGGPPNLPGVREGARAFWIQGGRWWDLQGAVSINTMVALASQMEAAIAKLPTE
jgi:hypothetical protein